MVNQSDHVEGLKILLKKKKEKKEVNGIVAEFSECDMFQLDLVD